MSRGSSDGTGSSSASPSTSLRRRDPRPRSHSRSRTPLVSRQATACSGSSVSDPPSATCPGRSRSRTSRAQRRSACSARRRSWPGLALERWQLLARLRAVASPPVSSGAEALRSPVRVADAGVAAAAVPVAALSVLAVLAVDLVVQPIWTDDAWSIWAAKANSIVLLGGLHPDYLASASVVSPSYPLVVPVLELVALRFCRPPDRAGSAPARASVRRLPVRARRAAARPRDGCFSSGRLASRSRWRRRSRSRRPRRSPTCRSPSSSRSPASPAGGGSRSARARCSGSPASSPPPRSARRSKAASSSRCSSLALAAVAGARRGRPLRPLGLAAAAVAL